MNEYKKAIQFLQIALNSAAQSSDNYGVHQSGYYEIGTAIKALEKQIPMKVEYYDEGDYAKCPNCDYQDFEYGINDWGCNFCSRCGQALDWSDTE